MSHSEKRDSQTTTHSPPATIQETLHDSHGNKVVPSEHESRTLILCFDGTGDKFDSDVSNVVQFFEALKKDDQSKQKVYYQTGIGTYTSSFFFTPILTKLSEIVDEGIAWNLKEHVIDGYKFIMQHYTAGDRVCLFGFSRGGYTARALAGMIHKIGVLPAGNHRQVPVAFQLFSQESEYGWKMGQEFKHNFCNDVQIEFLGVWDTVASVVTKLPFSMSEYSIRNFRHALSLDERRAKFKANVWVQPSHFNAHFRGGKRATCRPTSTAAEPIPNNDVKVPKQDSESLRRHVEQYEDPREPTSVEEVWFAGCHCDVGGGSVQNRTRYSLARIPLRWMIRECFKTRSGILFNSNKLRQIGLDSSNLAPTVKPRPPPLPVDGQKIPAIKDAEKLLFYGDIDIATEEHEELKDALSPEYDQLSLKWWWWILEYMPIRERRCDGKWSVRYRLNRGGPRLIDSKRAGVKVHRSVKTRMDAEYEMGGSKYEPRPGLLNVIWVD